MAAPDRELLASHGKFVAWLPLGEHHAYLPGDAPALACGGDSAELLLFPDTRFTTALVERMCQACRRVVFEGKV